MLPWGVHPGESEKYLGEWSDVAWGIGKHGQDNGGGLRAEGGIPIVESDVSFERVPGLSGRDKRHIF